MKYTRISKAEAVKITSKKGYCVGCGAYGRLTPSDFESVSCQNCRPLCSGSNEYPNALNVHGEYAKCHVCGKNVKLDREFGALGRHTTPVAKGVA